METKDKKIEKSEVYLDANGHLQNFEPNEPKSIGGSYLSLGLLLILIFAIIDVLAFGISKLFE